MIEKPIVLILGAGASWDYGFPTGPKLKAKIWEILSDGEFCCMSSLGRDGLAIFRSSLELTPDLSIDAFLEHNFKEFGEAGKAAIARVLLPYEKEANLFGGWMQKALNDKVPDTCDIPKDGQHWYSYLFNKMSEGCTFEDFKNNRLTVVTFNYDRSFEWFMLKALSAKYQKDIVRCKDVLESIPIIHIYGQLGEIEIFPGKESNACIEYDSWEKHDFEGSCEAVKDAAKSIKIIHEEHGLENLHKSQQAFKHAERIYFLGFGYHMANMEKLFRQIGNISGMRLGYTSNNLLKDTAYEYGNKCFGTAYGLPPHQRNQLEKFGLINMDTDRIFESGQDQSHSFENATIYDFLLYNHNAKL